MSVQNQRKNQAQRSPTLRNTIQVERSHKTVNILSNTNSSNFQTISTLPQTQNKKSKGVEEKVLPVMSLKSKFRKPAINLVHEFQYEQQGLNLPRMQRIVEDSGFTSMRGSFESSDLKSEKQINIELVKHKATVLRAKKLYEMWVHIDQKREMHIFENREMQINEKIKTEIASSTTPIKKINPVTRHFRNISQQVSSSGSFFKTDKVFKIAKQPNQSHLLQALNQEISSVQLQNAKVDRMKSQKTAGTQEWKKEIQSIDHDIKKIKTVLQRLAPINDSHIIIKPSGTSVEVMLFEGESVTYKIPSQGQPTDCEVKITYPVHDQNMTVFVSYSNPQPSKIDHDFRYFTPHKLVLKPEFSAKEFQNQFIYLTFLSDNSKCICLSARFGQQKIVNPKVPQKTQKTITDQDQIKKMRETWLIETRPLKTHIDISEQKMRRTQMLQTSEILKKDWNQRHLEAVMKRETDDDFFRMKTHLDQLKWDLFRKKKADLLEKRDRQLYRNQIAEFWIHQMLKHLLVKRFNEKTRAGIEVQVKHLKTVFLINLLKMRMKRKVQKLGGTIDERNKLLIRDSLAVISKIQHDKVISNARIKVKQFLEKKALDFAFNECMHDTFRKVILIQKGYRSHGICFKNREKYFFEEFWPVQVNKILQEAVEMTVRGNGSSFQTMQLKKVGVIDIKNKKRVLQLFMARQNMLHTLRFLNWLLIYRPEQYSDRAKNEEMLESIKTRLSQMYEIDSILFSHVDLPQPIQKSKQPKIAQMSEDAWNNLSRIAKLQFPIEGAGSGKIIKQKVPDKDFVYDIYIGKTIPTFTYVPISAEIFHRLILRAALAETNCSEFNLALSNC